MKELRLIIKEELFNELRSDLAGKAISGNLYTVTDAFLLKIVRFLENKNEVLKLGE